MSAAVGTFSASKEIPFSNEMQNEELKNRKENCNIKAASAGGGGDEAGNKDHDVDDHEDQVGVDDDEEDDSKLKSEKELDLGPQVSLKEHLEKDKDDDSLMRWKEQLLGSVDVSAVGECREPEVKILSLSILCLGRPDLVLPIPFATKSKNSMLFTLKEGSLYHLKLSFTVSNNIVSGLKYTNTVWKTGVRVDHTKVMLGTYSPQKEAYTFELEEETTPSGIFARGSYSARTKIVDDDGKCYLNVSYYFEIQKNWPSSS